MPGHSGVVLVDSLDECLFSARFWEAQLPDVARRMRNRATWFKLGTALLAALPGVALWTYVADSQDWWARLAASVVSLTAAGLVVWTKERDYQSLADLADQLTIEYGTVVGKIIDARATKSLDDDRVARDLFETVHAKRKPLNGYTADLVRQRQRDWDDRGR